MDIEKSMGGEDILKAILSTVIIPHITDIITPITIITGIGTVILVIGTIHITGIIVMGEGVGLVCT